MTVREAVRASVPAPRALRIYESVRSAHLERLRTMTPAHTVYHRTRYDYDPSLLTGPLRPQRVSRITALAEVLRRRYRSIEINEPLMTRRWPDLLAQVAAIRLRPLLRRPVAQVGAYCIGLTDPAAELMERYHLPRPVARAVATIVLRTLVRGMDRLAFGTPGSYDLVAGYVGAELLAPRAWVVPALPTSCDCPAAAVARDRNQVLFVGAFSERKGVRQLLAGWDALGEGRLRLHLIGTGPLEGEVRAWAVGRDDVDLEVDPPRSRVHEAYRRAHVVVLLSQRVGSWREQVGLPIVEALAHGCGVVTTNETGLATWLTGHGHVVLAPTASPDEVAAAVRTAAANDRSAAAVMADLPSVDTRLQADHWLHADADVGHDVDVGRDVERAAAAPITVVFPAGRGVDHWRERGRESPVPGRWPYGLDQLAAGGTALVAVEVPVPSTLARIIGRASVPAAPRLRVRGTALSWDEQTALRMVAAVRADAMVSGVIWVTDRLAQRERRSEVMALRRALLRLDGLWCLSAPQVAAVDRWLGSDCPPTHFVRFGVDEGFYAPASQPATARPLVASVGGDRDRDPHTLLAALSEVRRQRPDVDCVVQSSATLRPPDGVRVVPHLRHTEVRELLRRASVVAIATRPNLHVSGMTVALEAMAVARPVVVTATPGMDDYVMDGRTGRHVTPTDPRAMAAAILELLDDPSAATSMGAHARGDVEARFTTRQMCAHLRAVVSEAGS